MFYTFSQNNSGGYYKDPAKYVIVEAADSAEANKIAESVGVYFDGIGDCDCCGNRWSPHYSDSDDCYPIPSVYGVDITSFRYSVDWDDPNDDWASYHWGDTVLVVYRTGAISTTIQKPKGRI